MTTWVWDWSMITSRLPDTQAQLQGAALVACGEREGGQHAGDILGLPQHFIECHLGSLAAYRRDVDLTDRSAPFGRKPLDGRGGRDDLAGLGLAGHAVGRVHTGPEHIARFEHHGTEVATDAYCNGLTLDLEFGVRRNALLHLTRGIERVIGGRKGRHDLIANGLYDRTVVLLGRGAHHVNADCDHAARTLVTQVIE